MTSTSVHRASSRKRKQHLLLRVAITLGLTLLSLPMLSASASAAVVGGFEVDGNQVQNGNLDWANIGDVDVVRDKTGNQDDTTFGPGNSERDNDGVAPESAWSINASGTPAGKSDIGNVLVTDFEGPGGDTYAAFAWDRAGDVGTGRYYIELNQAANAGANPDRTTGDVRIIVGINGSDLLVCQSVETWQANDRWGGSQACGPATFDIVVNDGQIQDLFQSANAPLEANTFLEGVINLTDLGLTTCPVAGFQTINLRSQEGGENGDTSSLKDVATGPITIDSDCGSLTIVKNTEGEGTGEGAVFKIAPDPTAGSNAPWKVVTIGADGTFTIPAATPGDYKVTELAPPGGYLLPVPRTQDVTVPEGDPATVTFDDILGQIDFTKSYQGEDPEVGATFTLTRVKRFDFDTTPTGPAPLDGIDAPTLSAIDGGRTFDVTDNGANDDDPAIGKISVDGIQAGEWRIVEKSAPAGWVPAPANEPVLVVVGPTDDDAVKSLNPSGNPATFHNVLLPVALEVVKTLSVPGVPEDTEPHAGVTFQLFVDDGDGVAELGGEDALVSAKDTDANGEILWSGLDWQQDYWLKELKEPGYNVGLSPNPTLVTFETPTDASTVVTVEVDNPREEVSLEFEKVDELDSSIKLSGGTFVLCRDNGDQVEDCGGADTLLPGSETAVDGLVRFDQSEYQIPWGYAYWILETEAPENYDVVAPILVTETLTEPENADVTIDLGQVADPREPTTLTLVKEVVNTGTDGTATPSDWTLFADGAGTEDDLAGISGSPEVTQVEVLPGTFTLSESLDGPAGYTASPWDCGDFDVTGGNTVTLGIGDNAVCTITNTAQPGTFQVLKDSDPASGSTVEPTDVITYTITAFKTGGVDSTNVVVTDDLADVLDNATYNGDAAASTGTVQQVGDTLVWTIPTLSAGESEPETLTYSVTVDADQYGVTLRNVVTAPGADDCPDGDEDCRTTEHFTPHWLLSKDSVPAPGSTVQPGDTVTYTLTAENDSDAVLEGATAVDNLTAVLDDATLQEPLAAELSLSGNLLTWTLPTLQPGESVQVSYSVVVGADEWDEVLTNVVTPGDDAGDCVSVEECTTTHYTPHWTLEKSSDPESGSTVEPNDEVTYTLTATNDSLGTVSGVQAVDNLADVLDNATLVTTAEELAAQGLSLDPVSLLLTWDVPELAAGESVQVTYTVQVDDGEFGVTLRNVVTPGDESGDCVGECTTEHFTPHWTLEKSSDPESGSTVEPGDTVVYTLSVENDSDAVVAGATVSDDLQDVLDNATLEEPLAAGLTREGDMLTWALPTLDPGETASVSYAVVVGDGQWGVTLRNVATPDQPSGECVGLCSTEHFTPEWELTKVSDPVSGSEVMPGDEITYTLTVTNTSTDATVSNAVVEDDLSQVLSNATLVGTLPAELTLVGTLLTWDVDTLEPGESDTVSYTVQVNEGAWEQTLVNVATPGPDLGGECVTEGGCTTTHTTPPVHTLEVLKVDFETLEVLEGAEFQLYADNVPTGVLGPEDVAIGEPQLSGADGLTAWTELLGGDYIVEETAPPAGYDLPPVTFQAVTLAGTSSTVRITFEDPAQGQIAIVAKRQFELIGDEFVESDGIVAFGQQIKYVVAVQATGNKLFKNVRVTDYIPGFNPEDTTTTTPAELVPGTALCNGFDCEVTVGDDGLITWTAGTLQNVSGTVEFTVVFPPLPAQPEFDDNGQFREVLWNVGFLEYEETLLLPDEEPEPELARTLAARSTAAAGTPLGRVETVSRRLRSNEVVATAVFEQLPETRVPPKNDPPKQPPGVLPDTGAPANADLVGLLGGLAVGTGLWLMLRGRRREDGTVLVTARS